MKNTDNLDQSELLDERFLITVLDALERLSEGEGSGEIPSIVDVEACDVAEAAYRANCALADLAIPSNNLGPAKLKALILWQLGEALCP